MFLKWKIHPMVRIAAMMVLLWMMATMPAMAQSSSPQNKQNLKGNFKSKASERSDRQKGAANKAMGQSPPPGSSMQPPPGYPTGGSTFPGNGDGKTPPPGSSIGANYSAIPGYGSQQPNYTKDNPPPGSSILGAGLGGDKPRGYPETDLKFDGPPPGSRLPFAPAYADGMQRKLEQQAIKREEAERQQDQSLAMDAGPDQRQAATDDSSTDGESDTLDQQTVIRIAIGMVLLVCFAGASVVLGLVISSMTSAKGR